MPEQTTVAATTTPQPKKKSNTLPIVLLIILGVLALCSIFGAKLAGVAFKGFLATKGLKVDDAGKNVTIKTEDGTLTLDGNNGSGSIKTDEGEIKYGENLSLPADFPSNIPVYPGATIVTVSSKTAEGTAFVSFTINKSVAEVLAYYKEEMPKKGWTYTSEYAGSMLTYSNATLNLGIITSQAENGLVSVAISTSSNQ